jgi:hypothetical protein
MVRVRRERNNRHSNVIPIARLNLARSAGMDPVNAMAARISEGEQDYRSRMFTNALLAGIVGMLVMSGQWMVTIVASIH